MNSLSWMIFALGIFEHVQAYLTFPLIFAWIILIIAIIAYGISNIIRVINDSESREKFDVEAWNNWLPIVKTVIKRSIVAVIILSIINIIAIDKKYMIMIAASEVGEMIVQSETVKNAATDLSKLSNETTDLLSAYMKVETNKLKKELEQKTSN